MKKIIVISFSLLLFGLSNGYSQEKKPFPFQFGFRVAPNVAWMKPYTDNYSSDGAKVGFSWGFIVEYFLSNNYGLNTGFNLNNVRGTLKYPVKFDSVRTGWNLREYNVKYIEFPLILKMKTNEIGYFSYYAQIGLGTNFNISARAKDRFQYTASGQAITETNEHNIHSEVSFIRESLIIGAGLQYRIAGTTSALVGFTFNNGFTNVLRGDNNDPAKGSLSNEAHSNFFELNLGIIF